MALIIGGKTVTVPGLTTYNWHDDPSLRLKMGQDGRRRRPTGSAPRVSIIGVHTTRGIPGGKDKRSQLILDGVGPSTDGGRRVNGFWVRDPKYSGAHLVVDHDAATYCLADLELEEAFHATTINPLSIGIELVQGGRAELYRAQVSALLLLVNALTTHFGIQRQIPSVYKGRPHRRLVAGGSDFWGVVGHRDQTDNRGRGDPGDFVMNELAAAGYERFDLDAGADRAAWRARQQHIGLTGADVDGIPGARTTGILRDRGYRHGLWALPPAERIDTLT